MIVGFSTFKSLHLFGLKLSAKVKLLHPEFIIQQPYANQEQQQVWLLCLEAEVLTTTPWETVGV